MTVLTTSLHGEDPTYDRYNVDVDYLESDNFDGLNVDYTIWGETYNEVSNNECTDFSIWQSNGESSITTLELEFEAEHNPREDGYCGFDPDTMDTTPGMTYEVTVGPSDAESYTLTFEGSTLLGGPALKTTDAEDLQRLAESLNLNGYVTLTVTDDNDDTFNLPLKTTGAGQALKHLAHHIRNATSDDETDDPACTTILQPVAAMTDPNKALRISTHRVRVQLFRRID
ncbi:MAG: hypothetical protein OXG24_02265 [Gammaproteobacteria bacterium]|nr:hypothetical protein [Gammaproteobacteria bacterium]